MIIKRKIIRLPLGNVEKMAKAFDCASSSVYNALNGSSNSEKAKAIRKKALEEYGGETETKVIFQ